jgi:hypothetical protein
MEETAPRYEGQLRKYRVSSSGQRISVGHPAWGGLGVGLNNAMPSKRIWLRNVTQGFGLGLLRILEK